MSEKYSEKSFLRRNRIAMLPYTICFCKCGDKVLMLYRHKSPNRHLWNGLGGKLQPDETPFAGVRREIMEEAGIDLQTAKHFYFAGVVTWNSTNASKGMYAFVAKFSSEWVIWEGERPIEEGILCWKSLQWVCDPHNPTVVSNIPHFLPDLLSQTVPLEYYCDYQDGQFVRMVARQLPMYYSPLTTA